MPVTNKPIPKTVAQRSNQTINPIEGNPNITPNRGNDISVKNDTQKQINIRLIDIYETVKYYINNVIQPIVIENNQQVNVPVQFAYGERWNAVQKEGVLRDKEGRVLLPMIVIKRDTVVKNRTLGNKLDGNNVQLYQSFETKYTRKNQYDAFAILTNRIPVKQYHIAPVPDYVVVTYNASILTNSVEQCDDIIQAFNFAGDSYWGQADRYRFSVVIDSFTDTVEYSQGEDRSVRSNFNIVVNAYLLPDSVNRSVATQKKVLSKAVVKFTSEIVPGSTNVSKRIIQVLDKFIDSDGSYFVNYNGEKISLPDDNDFGFIFVDGTYFIDDDGSIIAVS